jgi:hypothetical protein
MSSCILKEGNLIFKKSLFRDQRYAVLCCPVEVTDLETLYTHLFSRYDFCTVNQFDPAVVVPMGHLAFASVKSTLLLLLTYLYYRFIFLFVVRNPSVDPHEQQPKP